MWIGRMDRYNMRAILWSMYTPTPRGLSLNRM